MAVAMDGAFGVLPDLYPLGCLDGDGLPRGSPRRAAWSPLASRRRRRPLLARAMPRAVRRWVVSRLDQASSWPLAARDQVTAGSSPGMKLDVGAPPVPEVPPGFRDGVENRNRFFKFFTAASWRDASNNVSAVIATTASMESASFPGDALNKKTSIFIDEDGHLKFKLEVEVEVEEKKTTVAKY